MLLSCFNCPKCLQPYDRAGLFRVPMVDNGRVFTCASCSDPTHCIVPFTFVNDLLEQPNIKRTSDGWIAVGPLESKWKCQGCIYRPGAELNLYMGAMHVFSCLHTGHRYYYTHLPQTTNCCGKESCSNSQPAAYKSSTRLATVYQNYVQKVANAVQRIEKSLKTELTLDPTCTRCEKSLGPVKNRLVISCSSVLCPECYYTMDMRNDCHICGESLYLHLEPGRKLLEEVEAEKAKKSAVSDVESEEYGEIINANDCQDVVNFVNVTSKKLERCQDPSLAELWRLEKMSMNDECGTLSASSTGKTRIRTWRNVNEPFSSDEAYEYDDGNDE